MQSAPPSSTAVVHSAPVVHLERKDTFDKSSFISTFSHLKTDSASPERPSSIWVIGKDGSASQIGIDELESKQNMKWIEDVIVSHETTIGKFLPSTEAAMKSNSECAWRQKIKHYLDNITLQVDRIALLDMAELGYGTVTREEIKKEDFVTFYAGDLKDVKGSIYGLGAEMVLVLPFAVGMHIVKMMACKYPCMVDATEYGNVSRFFPHLPHPEELKNAELPDISISEVATQNLNDIHVKMGCKMLPALVASETISPGELMGYSYGPRYWRALNKTFWLFKKNGEKLVEVKYDQNGRIVLASKKLLEKSKDTPEVRVTINDDVIRSAPPTSYGKLFSTPSLPRANDIGTPLLETEQEEPGCWEAFKKCIGC